MLLDAAARKHGMQMACTVAWHCTAGRVASGCGLAAVVKAKSMCCTASWDTLRAAFGTQVASAHLLQSCVRDVQLQTSGRPRCPGAAPAHITQLGAWQPGQRYSRTFASPPHILRRNKRCVVSAEPKRNGTKLSTAAWRGRCALSARLGKWVPLVRATMACTTLYVCLQRLSTVLTRVLASHRRACLEML